MNFSFYFVQCRKVVLFYIVFYTIIIWLVFLLWMDVEVQGFDNVSEV